MKTIRMFLIVFAAIAIFNVGIIHPQRYIIDIPKENMPSNIPGDLRAEIEKLYSSSPVNRGYAAIALGDMGEKASPAVPFLIGILDDYTSLHWVNEKFHIPTGSTTSPSELAIEALGRIRDARAV